MILTHVNSSSFPLRTPFTFSPSRTRRRWTSATTTYQWKLYTIAQTSISSASRGISFTFFFFLKLSSYYATVNDVIIHTTKCQDFVYFQDGSRIVLKNAIRLASGGRRVARWRFTIIELVIYNNYFNCSPKLVVFNNFILVISLKKPMKFGPVRRSIIEHTFARPANEKNVPTKKKRSMALRVLPLQILNINDN